MKNIIYILLISSTFICAQEKKPAVSYYPAMSINGTATINNLVLVL